MSADTTSLLTQARGVIEQHQLSIPALLDVQKELEQTDQKISTLKSIFLSTRQKRSFSELKITTNMVSSTLSKFLFKLEPHKSKRGLKEIYKIYKQLESIYETKRTNLRDMDTTKLKGAVKPSIVKKKNKSTRLKEIIKLSKTARDQRLNRLQKLGAISATERKLLQELEKELETGPLQQTALALQEVEKKLKADPNNEQLKQDFHDLQLAWDNLLDELKIKYSDLDVNFWVIDSYKTGLFVDANFYYFEMVINKSFHNFMYLKEAQLFMDSNQQKILESFVERGVISNAKLEQLRSEEIKITMIDQEGETHNAGKKAMLVQIGDFKFVYKPRSGVVDEVVIDLFGEINALPKEQRSSKHPLPTYSIINPTAKDGWKHTSEVGSVSLWEFVEGEMVDASMGAYIDSTLSHTEPDEIVKLLKGKLNRLDAILSTLNITDLHQENVFLQGIEGINPEIIPIDLEAVEANCPTLLAGKPEKVKLTKQEHALIKQAELKIKKAATRVIPVSTNQLTGLVMFQKVELATKMIAESLESLDYELTISFEELEELIYKDCINSDVPYFSVEDGKLYYGLPSNGVVIGNKRG